MLTNERVMLVMNHSDAGPVMNQLPKARSVSLGNWTWFLSTLVYDIEERIKQREKWFMIFFTRVNI